MTALTKYDRLEATGLWRETPQARLREVIVGLRNTTLLLTDPRTEQPITQWSLPAIRRLNPGGEPAIFAPSDDAEESLEINDVDMIVALGQLRRVLEKRRVRPGRLRMALSLGSALAVVGLVVFVLPDRLVNYTVSVLPDPALAALGQTHLTDLARLTGSPCTRPQGQSAADGLARQLFAANPPRIVVLRDGLTGPKSLPGRIIALPLTALDMARGPEEIAGALLIEAARDPGTEPLVRLLHHAGLFATLGLLTSGQISPESVAGFGDETMAERIDLEPLFADPVRMAALIEAFRAAGLSTLPWAESRATGTGTGTGPQADLARALIAADPFPEGGPAPILEDADWLMLQAICG
jgi:hypothetical protein